MEKLPALPESEPSSYSDWETIKSKEPYEHRQDVVENQLYDLVAAAIRKDFPELDLSNSDLMNLSESVIRPGDSLMNLRSLERSG